MHIDLLPNGTNGTFLMAKGERESPEFARIGPLGATCWVVASNAKSEIKAFARILQTSGYPVWVCDGVADQVEIQAAITASAGIGSVHLSGGLFDISAHITLVTGMDLRGEGTSTILRLHDYTDDNVFEHLAGTAISDIAISDLAIDGNQANQNPIGMPGHLYPAALDVSSASGNSVTRMTLEGLAIYNCKSISVITKAPINQLKIVNCNFYGNATSHYIDLIYGSDCVIANNTFTHAVGVNTGYGSIEIQYCKNVTVADNSIVGSGITIFGSTHCSFTGNVIRFPGTGTFYFGFDIHTHSAGDYSEYNVISGNTIHGFEITGATNVGSAGFLLSQDDAPGFTGGNRYNSFLGNTIENVYMGIYTRNGLCNIKNEFSDNHISHVTFGLLAEQGAGGVALTMAFSRNTIIDAVEGVYWTAGTWVGAMEGNYITDWSGRGVRIESDGMVIPKLFNNRIIGDVATAVYSPSFIASAASMKYYSFADVFRNIHAASATAIRSNEDLSEAIPNTFTLDAQPDVPRNLVWSFDSHAQITAFSFTITGTDAKGGAISDTFTQASGWSGSTGQAYAKITSIIMTSRTGTGAGDTMDIGTGDILGLANDITRINYVDSVYKVAKNGVDSAIGTINYGNDTVDCATIVNGDDFTIWYRVNTNIFY